MAVVELNDGFSARAGRKMSPEITGGVIMTSQQHLLLSARKAASGKLSSYSS